MARAETKTRPEKKRTRKQTKAANSGKKAKVAKTEAEAKDAAPAETLPAALPVLYRKPTPLTAERHGKKALSRKTNFAFAAGANSVPINAAEFRLAMKYYPIVFAGSDPVMAVVILGLTDSENLFVGKDGQWRDGNYIPAYVRRYPFIFMTGPEQQQFVLCVDDESELIVDKGEQSFFDGDKPSAATDRALKFCSAYQTQSEMTKQFASAMDEAGLLEPNQAEIRLSSGEKLALGGFRVINEEKFANLPDKTFLDWRKKGWLPLIYAHLFSTSNWNRLISLRGQDG
jgi:hypothetical protein